MTVYIFLFLIFLVAGFTQGVTGFGFGLLAIPLMSLFIDIKTGVPLCSLLGTLVTVFLTLRLRKHIDRRKILPLLFGCIPGVAAGTLMLKKAPAGLLSVLMGVMLIAFVLYRLASKQQPRSINPRWAYVAGFFTGAISSAFSAGGPPTIIYATLRGWNKDEIKATLSGFFLTGGLAVITAHAITGLTTSLVLHYFLLSAPVVIGGMFVGSLLYDRVDTSSYLKLLHYLLLVMGILMIWKGTWWT
ncbi:MAG: sulfite exporter TauE/SafE family protein [Proteobacteria bacterium]|jgi:uncharacterized membrane protein YfcA|nr:sulfite exporter TauE/SafE family protein [Pseudomonadota bacterium]